MSLEMRREAVFGFITPLVTALLRADVATRNEVFASSTFLSATAVWTFFARLLTALSAARFRAWRLSACRARRIVDLWMTGIAISCTKGARLYHMARRIVKAMLKASDRMEGLTREGHRARPADSGPGRTLGG